MKQSIEGQFRSGFARWVVGAAAALLVAGSVSAQTKLKFAHVYETSEPYHTAAVWAAGEIAKRTSNRYTVEVFPASHARQGDRHQPGADARHRRHHLHRASSSPGAPTGRIAIGGAPYMFRDFDHWKAFSTSPLFGELAEGYRSQERRQQGRGDHLLRRAPRHLEQGDQQARGHEGPEDPRARRAAVHDVPARGGRQSHADRVRRGVPRAAERHRGRAGEPAADDRREEVLRSAEVHRAHRPHHRCAADHRRRRRRGASSRTPTRRSSKTVLREAAARATARDHRDREASSAAEFEKRGKTVVKVDREPFREVGCKLHNGPDATWDKAMYDKLQALK